MDSRNKHGRELDERYDGLAGFLLHTFDSKVSSAFPPPRTPPPRTGLGSVNSLVCFATVSSTSVFAKSRTEAHLIVNTVSINFL